MSVARGIRQLWPGQPLPVNEVDDAQLVARYVLTREEVAFTELLRRHGPMVTGVCQRVLSHAQDAEDACQATFFVLARDAWRISKRESVGSWLFGVALRLARKARQLHTRERQQLMQVAQAGTVQRDETNLVEAMEEVAFLPEPYRTPVVLCWLEGRTQQEAAELLGWPLGSVAGRLARAKEMLKPRLLRRGLAPGVLVSLSSFGIVQTLSAEKLAEAAQRALGQSQSATIQLLTRSSMLPWWVGSFVALVLLASGAGWWWSKSQPAEPGMVFAPTADPVEELTLQALQGQWTIVSGGWDKHRFRNDDFHISITGNKLKFQLVLTEDGGTRPGLTDFLTRQAWDTPLAFSFEKENLTINFPYPANFRIAEMNPQQFEVAQRNRSGLIRLKDGELEIAIGCRMNSLQVTNTQALAEVPRPTAWQTGPETLYMKLRRLTPLERLQGWWMLTKLHEVTQLVMKTEFLVVRVDKLTSFALGESMENVTTFKLVEKDGSLVLHSTNLEYQYDPVTKKVSKNQQKQQLVLITDGKLKLASFGKFLKDEDQIVADPGNGVLRAFVSCPVPAGATWENLKQWEKEYVIESAEYQRSSRGSYFQRQRQALATAQESASARPRITSSIRVATVSRLFRMEVPVSLTDLQRHETVQLLWIAKPGAEPVLLLDQVTVSEASKLGKNKDGVEQMAVTLQLSPNEARLLELFVEGGKYQVKRK